jgi:ATP-dependent helicase/DNAse subunit B
LKSSDSEVNKSIEIGGAFYVQLKTPFQTNEKAIKRFQHRGCFDKALLRGECAYLDNLDSKDGASKQFLVSTRSSDPVDKEQLWSLVDQTKEIIELLIKMILEGEYSAKPISCNYCMAKSVCRFDPRRSKTKKLNALVRQVAKSRGSAGRRSLNSSYLTTMVFMLIWQWYVAYSISTSRE